MKKIPWQIRQRHDTEIEALLKALGFVVNGQVRKFDGRIFWPALFNIGHTAVDIDLCECSKEDVPAKRK